LSPISFNFELFEQDIWLGYDVKLKHSFGITSTSLGIVKFPGINDKAFKPELTFFHSLADGLFQMLSSFLSIKILTPHKSVFANVKYSSLSKIISFGIDRKA